MNAPVSSNTKAELLQNVVEHVDITSFDARPIIDSMRKMSFSSRDTARAADIFSMAIEDADCSPWLILAGSTSAGGCMDVYRDMVKFGMVDAVVATGASIVDMDFFEALGFKHYQAAGQVDDNVLRDNYIDRIYDTYIDEEQLQACDHTILEIANRLEPRGYSSREFIWEMGKWLSEGNAKKPGSLIQTAYEEGVPIFCPDFVNPPHGADGHVHDEHCGHDHHHHDHDHGHDHHDRAHSHGARGHTHQDDIKGISLSLDRPLDGTKFTAWLDRLLGEQGQNILRAKGIIDVKGEDRRLVFQAVHMILEGELQREWGAAERRWSRAVFIGRDLDEAELRKGFEACAA